MYTKVIKTVSRKIYAPHEDHIPEYISAPEINPMAVESKPLLSYATSINQRQVQRLIHRFQKPSQRP
jgi:hypothetical protein